MLPGTPDEVLEAQPDKLRLAQQMQLMQQQATFEAVPLDPRADPVELPCVSPLPQACVQALSYWALGDERHMLLELHECPALADLRNIFFPLVTLIIDCSGVMAWLVGARNQPTASRYISACFDIMS